MTGKEMTINDDEYARKLSSARRSKIEARTKEPIATERDLGEPLGLRGELIRSIPQESRMTSVALVAFFKIAKLWNLSTPQQMKLLGMTSTSSFYRYKRIPERALINQDRLERLSFVLGIYQDLHTLLSNEQSALDWIKKPNKAEPFCGRSALEYMIEQGRIPDLYHVRQYLADQRGV